MSDGAVTASASPEAAGSHPHDEMAGKHMTFKLGTEEYGLEILKVRELIALLPITPIPGTKPFIRGVINLRGKVIPVVDLRLKFAMPRVTATDQTVIIVVQYVHEGRDLIMGVLVDEVVEVLDIKPGQIEPPPDFGAGNISTEYILGIGKADHRVICLLDIDRVLNADEVRQLEGAARLDPEPE